MRILITAFCPLDSSYGAAQLAINLAGALRERGHEVVTWSPGAPQARLRWWRDMAWKRTELERFLTGQPPFDVIDAPPVAITRRVSRLAPTVIARSVQPDLRYLAWEIREAVRRLMLQPLRAGAAIVSSIQLAGFVVAGWHRAHVILCLGQHEEAWMRSRFRWLRSRLGRYSVTVSPAEKTHLREIRTMRTPPQGSGMRFLWIGRWAAHKGTRRLVRFIREWAVDHPNDCFTIAGCGTAAECDLPSGLLRAGRVRVVPSFTHEQLYELVASHDTGLFTSEVEGWGLTLNEMLESGMQVFATDAGAVAELRQSYPGQVVPFPEDGGAPSSQSTGLCTTLAEQELTWPDIGAQWEHEVELALSAGAKVRQRGADR